ncbi:MAG: 50S ribosomal protein L25 [Oligoflexia bacterium]|nr:50S ribosomal protein L25 [Oligoflexia bacterium]
MKTIELEVGSRAETGKGANRRLRRDGLIPAVVYGASKKNFNLQTSRKIVTNIVNGGNDNAIITLKSSDKDVNGKYVLLKQWDRDITTRLPRHVDFYEIDLKKTVRVNVGLKFVGKAKGIGDGGLLEPVAREITVDCLPTAIPETIEVDVSGLGIGDSLHVEDLIVPEGIKKVYNDNFTIVTCTYVKEEVIVAPVAGAEGAAAAPAEPEVIAKGKKDEEGAPAAAGEKKAPEKK